MSGLVIYRCYVAHVIERNIMDDKTKQEREVMDALKASKGFTTIFWITSNQRRASIVEKLEKRGNLVRVGNHSYAVIRF